MSSKNTKKKPTTSDQPTLPTTYTIDLSRVMARPSLKTPEEVPYDMRKDIGDKIYFEAYDTETFQFGIDVFNLPEGERSFSPSEAQVLLSAAQGIYPIWKVNGLLGSFVVNGDNNKPGSKDTDTPNESWV